MPTNTRTTLVVPILAALLVMASCDNGGSTTPVDFSTDDMVTDMADTGYDTTPYDTTPDTTPTDTGWDPLVDTTGDTVYDPGPDTPPAGGVVGDACTVTANCTGVPGAGRLCLTDLLGYLSFNGGYCSAACTSATDCGAGGDCVDVYGYRYCLKRCTSAGDCRTAEGYSCTTLPGGPTGTFCLPPSPDPETTTDY